MLLFPFVVNKKDSTFLGVFKAPVAAKKKNAGGKIHLKAPNRVQKERM